MAKKKKPGKRKAGEEAKSRSVAIDMDVHKLIESARRDFAETESAILRRLLGLDGSVMAAAEDGPETPAGTPDAPAPGRRAKGGGAADGGWSKIGRHGRVVHLPDGTKLRAAYAGQTVEGEVREGMWAVGAGRYNSPSAALIAHARTREGASVNLNGWRHWEVRLPGEEVWRRLGEL